MPLTGFSPPSATVEVCRRLWWESAPGAETGEDGLPGSHGPRSGCRAKVDEPLTGQPWVTPGDDIEPIGLAGETEASGAARSEASGAASPVEPGDDTAEAVAREDGATEASGAAGRIKTESDIEGPETSEAGATEVSSAAGGATEASGAGSRVKRGWGSTR
jgi:hypothetical protein